MNGKPWLQVHSDALKELAGFCSDQEIAQLTGHATVTVRVRRSALGLPAYHHANRRVRYGTWEDLPAHSLEAIRRAAIHT